MAISETNPLVGTKLCCLVTEAHRCEQLAQGYYTALPWVRIESATYLSQVQRYTRCATAPPRMPYYEDMTSFIQVHNVLHYCQRKTEPRPQVTSTENFMKYGLLKFSVNSFLIRISLKNSGARGCNPHRSTTTLENLIITSLWHHWWRHNSETIRDREKRRPLRPMKSSELSNGENRIALRQLLQNRKLRHLW